MPPDLNPAPLNANGLVEAFSKLLDLLRAGAVGLPGVPPPTVGPHSLLSVPPEVSTDPQWLLFSDLELRILRAIGDKALSAEQIARATGEAVSGRLRSVLANLVDRRVLYVDRDGYRVHYPSGVKTDASDE